MNTKPQAVTDPDNRPIRSKMTAGEIGDYPGAAALPGSRLAAKWLIGDRGFGADSFQEALNDKGVCPGILGRKSREHPVEPDTRLSM